MKLFQKRIATSLKEFDTFPKDIRTPIFYVLQKIHKVANENLPIRYPGRPIVSSCNSATENISKFLDSVLHPYVTSLSSHIKDTTDFIKKVKNIKFCSKDSYLVTLDVSSLYTNIPHEDGILACKSFLEKDGTSTERITEIEELMKLVLENNHFKFDGNHYLQKLGTAIGSSMAPLFMGKFEEDFLQSRALAPTVWFRFLHDIFMIWDHSYEELESFISDINSFHPNIIYSCSTSKQCIPFLDVQVIKSDSLSVETDIYEKPTNNHQYLDYTSCHPKSCKTYSIQPIKTLQENNFK